MGSEHAFAQVDLEMELVMKVVTRTRNLRADYELQKQRPKLFLSVSGDADARVAPCLTARHAEIAALSTSESAEVLPPGARAPPGCGVAIVSEAVTVHMLLVGRGCAWVLGLVLAPCSAWHQMETRMQRWHVAGKAHQWCCGWSDTMPPPPGSPPRVGGAVLKIHWKCSRNSCCTHCFVFFWGGVTLYGLEGREAVSKSLGGSDALSGAGIYLSPQQLGKIQNNSMSSIAELECPTLAPDWNPSGMRYVRG
jgi:hypothetical protein